MTSSPGLEKPLPAELTLLGARVWQIAMLYGLVGILWITLSDSAMAFLLSEDALVRLGIFKGLAFVTVTTGLLYILNRRSFHEVCKGYQSTEQEAAERRRAEHETRGLAERLTTTFESITDAFYTVDREWCFTYINNQAEKIMRCERDKVRGKLLWELFPDAVGTRFHQEFLRAISENVTTIFEEYYPPFDCWFEVRAFPSPNGLAVYFRDVSEQRRAVEAIRVSEERFRLLTRATQDAIWDWDMGSGSVIWNEGFQTLTGFGPEDMVNTWSTATALLPPEEREEILADLSTEIESGAESWSRQHRIARKDRSYAWVLDRCFVMRDQQGRAVRAIGSMTDLTEQKRIEADLLRAQRLDSIGTLAGGIAHDLNNVLTPILMAMELLIMDETDPERLSMLRTAEASAKRGAKMVGQVLSFARGGDGPKRLVQLEPILTDLARIVRDTFCKSITIATEIPDGLWPVLGDPTQIHQVLLNLCVNARDAMPEGGRLTISARNETLDEQYAVLSGEVSPGAYIRLEVEDTGVGISPDIVDKIFDPFFTTKEVGKGTGLGLSTSLGIVKSHGGSLRVYSEADAGSKFRIYLPAGTETAELEQPAGTDLPRGDGRLVLVVDDEITVREITRRTLEAYGYRVETASDGAEAIAVYAGKQGEIAIVLTDMMMPVMDGLATIRVLRKMNPAVRIVAASGLAANGGVAKAASEGVRHFLPKPYTAAQLLKTLWLAQQEG